MNWNIEYYSSKVEAMIFELPDGLLARYLFVKKTQKTPKKEMTQAIRRMKEVLDNES